VAPWFGGDAATDRDSRRRFGDALERACRGEVPGWATTARGRLATVIVRTTELLDEIRRASELGIDVGEPRVDWGRVIDRKETFTRPVTAATERSLAEQGIDLLRGTPRFTDPHALVLEGTDVEMAASLVATAATRSSRCSTPASSTATATPTSSPSTPRALPTTC